MNKLFRKLISLFLAAALALTFSIPVSAGQDNGIQSVRSSIAARLDSVVAELDSLTPGNDYVDKEGVFIADTREEAERIASQYNGNLKSYNHRIGVVQFKESTVEALSTAAEIDSADTLVEPNYICHTMDVKSDTALSINSINSSTSAAYHTESTLSNDPYANSANTYYQYFHEKIHTPEAHKYTTGEGAKIAVLDTGCTPDHEDSAFDAEHSLCISSLSTGTDTTVGHGIHCTGIIHEKKNNSLGGFGVAPDAEIYSIKVSDEEEMSDSSIMEGYSMAMELGVNVISISIGGPGAMDSFQMLINEAYNKGILTVAAAGNDGEEGCDYPAAYDHVLSVAATDKNDSLAKYSNYGDLIKIAAPGTAITSTYIYPSGKTFAGDKAQNAYGKLDGTSMATPVVAGVAALCYAANPDFCDMCDRVAVDVITEAILNNTDGKEYTYSDHSVTGLIQADKTVEVIQNSLPKTYSLVDEAGNYGGYITGTIARGKTVKLKIGDLKGNTENYEKALQEAKWTSSSASVTVKDGEVTCDKNAKAFSEAVITAEIGGDRLRYKYYITEPLIGAGVYTVKEKRKGFKVKIKSKYKNKEKLSKGSAIDLRSPYKNFIDRGVVIALLYSKNYTGNNLVGYYADDKFKYQVKINKKYIDKGRITIEKNSRGLPVRVVFNKGGKYKIKFKTIEGSKKSFTFNVNVADK